jgi:hypothetical protein
VEIGGSESVQLLPGEVSPIVKASEAAAKDKSDEDSWGRQPLGPSMTTRPNIRLRWRAAKTDEASPDSQLEKQPFE